MSFVNIFVIQKSSLSSDMDLPGFHQVSRTIEWSKRFSGRYVLVWWKDSTESYDVGDFFPMVESFVCDAKIEKCYGALMSQSTSAAGRSEASGRPVRRGRSRRALKGGESSDSQRSLFAVLMLLPHRGSRLASWFDLYRHGCGGDLGVSEEMTSRKYEVYRMDAPLQTGGFAAVQRFVCFWQDAMERVADESQRYGAHLLPFGGKIPVSSNAEANVGEESEWTVMEDEDQKGKARVGQGVERMEILVPQVVWKPFEDRLASLERRLLELELGQVAQV